MKIDEAQRIAVAVSDIYAENCGIERDELWHLVKLQEELGELSAAWLSASGRGRDRGMDAPELNRAVADELADLFAQLLLFAHREGIDLGAALTRKWGRYLPEG
ncbi:MAG: hypothetical protein P8X50_17445 [Maritimibacter sp.]